MKICLVDNDLRLNLNFRGNVIKAFLDRGHEVIVITPKDETIKIEEFDSRLRFVPVKLGRKSKNPFKDVLYCIDLYKIYKEEKFDIIFHYTIKPNIYGNIAAALCKIKSISIIPGLGHLFIKESVATKIVEILYRIALRFAKEVWFLNNDDMAEFLERKLVSKEKVKILPGEGIDLDKFKPMEKQRKDDKIVFLMIARILWEKGFKEYVETAEILKKKYDNLEFQLLGEIDLDVGVPKEIVKKYNDLEIINYLGTSKEVPKIIAECDCLVLPSFYREGIPRTLMEGAAMEKVLITTNNIGCREVVIDDYNGFLCEVKNSEDLVSKMEKFITLSEKEKETMGNNGRKLMREKFTDRIIISKYISLLRGE